MPTNKLLKAGLEGLVRDNADNRSLSENFNTGKPETSFTATNKPASPEKASDAGSTCKFSSSN